MKRAAAETSGRRGRAEKMAALPPGRRVRPCQEGATLRPAWLAPAKHYCRGGGGGQEMRDRTGQLQMKITLGKVTTR